MKEDWNQQIPFHFTISGVTPRHFVLLFHATRNSSCAPLIHQNHNASIFPAPPMRYYLTSESGLLSHHFLWRGSTNGRYRPCPKCGREERISMSWWMWGYTDSQERSYQRTPFRAQGLQHLFWIRWNCGTPDCEISIESNLVAGQDRPNPKLRRHLQRAVL